MKFDDFLASVDRSSPIPVKAQVATILSLLDEATVRSYSHAVAAMPDDVSDAFGEWVHARLQSALAAKSQKAVVAKGRPRVADRRVPMTVTLPLSLIDRMPYPRSTFVERAIVAALGDAK